MENSHDREEQKNAAKLFDAELRLMELLWLQGTMPAKEITALARTRIGWNKNTTYTVLNKLAAKGTLSRSEPGFVCTPLVSREEVLRQEISTLITRFCWGSAKSFFSAFVEAQSLSWWELDELEQLIADRKNAALDAASDTL